MSKKVKSNDKRLIRVAQRIKNPSVGTKEVADILKRVSKRKPKNKK